MNAVLNIDRLEVGFNYPILRSDRLSVDSGSCVALTGRNGSGKTTFLKTICGLLQPLKGQVMLDERDIHAMHIHERAKLITGVFHQRIPLPSLEVHEVVAMGRFAFTTGKEADAEVVKRCIEQTGIAHLSSKKINELSDGEWQKTMIARALAQQPGVLVLDEPTAYLDYIAREEIMTLMNEVASTTHTTIVFSSHDLDMVKKFADWRWDVQDGMIHASHAFMLSNT
jgi:iron complex transport system ATP-binding protein